MGENEETNRKTNRSGIERDGMDKEDDKRKREERKGG